MKRLALLVVLSGCVEAPPPAPATGSQGDALGVPRGSVLFSNPGDATAFDGYVEQFAPLNCRSLAASVAAIRAQPARGSGERAAAQVTGALIPGVAGRLTRIAGNELAANAASRGNIQLSAAEAVRAAKAC